jgi:hypothetical protein
MRMWEPMKGFMMINYQDKYRVVEQSSGIIYASYNELWKARLLRKAMVHVHRTPFSIVGQTLDD